MTAFELRALIAVNVSRSRGIKLVESGAWSQSVTSTQVIYAHTLQYVTACLVSQHAVGSLYVCDNYFSEIRMLCGWRATHRSSSSRTGSGRSQCRVRPSVRPLWRQLATMWLDQCPPGVATDRFHAAVVVVVDSTVGWRCVQAADCDSWWLAA